MAMTDMPEKKAVTYRKSFLPMTGACLASIKKHLRLWYRHNDTTAGGFVKQYYPSATSRTIMTEKPMRVKRAMTSLRSFVWLSGMSSSTTT